MPPEDAFGQPNENNVQRIPRAQFDDDGELEIGLVFSLPMPAVANCPEWWSPMTTSRSPSISTTPGGAQYPVRRARAPGRTGGVALMECCWPTRAAFAPVWIALSISSTVPWRCSARRFYVRHEVVHNKFVVEDLRSGRAVRGRT